MQIDAPAPRTRDLDANFIDDEDLQAALARSRRQKVKRAKVTPEEIAARREFHLAHYRLSSPLKSHDDLSTILVAQERNEAESRASAPVQNGTAQENDTAMNGTQGENDDGGLTFDDTTEFVRNIAYDPTPQAPRPIAITIRTQRSPERDEAVTEMDVDVKRESGEESEGEMEDEDEAALHFIEQAINGAAGKGPEPKTEEVDDLVSGFMFGP